MKKKTATNKPLKVGQKIWVDTHLSISEGSRDVTGGVATVSRVYVPKYMDGIWFVEVKEHPGHSYNWTQILSKEQKKLKKEFGNQVAHPSPDIDTPWIERGDTVSFGGDVIEHTDAAIW